MALISLKDLRLRFSDEALFDGIDLHIQEGDRICLLGRNGAGKSTLLRLMNGQYTADSGDCAVSREIKLLYLDQESDAASQGKAIDYCLEYAATRVDAEIYLNRLGINPEDDLSFLSGGARRRVMLAAVLSGGADVLLLDEPTNHLDIDTVIWLEDHLKKNARTLVMITHDRAFARAVGNRVAELDRGKLYSFDCGYTEFLQRRDELLAAEKQQRVQFDKKMAQEEAWLRRGVKARRTRDEGRVRALMRMRDEYRQRRERQGNVQFSLQESGRSGDLVAELHDVSFTYPGERAAVIENLHTSIMRGDKVGIAGPNGAGKTTLIRLLLGDLKPDTGSVRLGTNIQTVYFDQMRSQLDPEKTVQENLSGGDDQIMVNGKARHIHAYLQDFLFEPDRARNPVKILSGGERNRLLLAKLFAQPSNLLVLDEPTNDLDMETLDLLEDLLLEYSGTVLLVSHDREFLDNVVSDCLVFTGDAGFEEYVGGYSDWRNRNLNNVAVDSNLSQNSKPPTQDRPQSRQRKISFKEKQELETLPDQISALEEEISVLQEKLADPEVYKNDAELIPEYSSKLQKAEAELESAFERWDELEQIAQQGV
ncbi:ATP-binding cassette domain-containing protein [Spirochaeta dissipatitropha]